MSEVEKRIINEVNNALKLVSAFCGDPRRNGSTFLRSLPKSMSILKHKRNFTWEPPKNTKKPLEPVSQKLDDFLKNNSDDKWGQEYLLCNGLIRTSKNKSVGHHRGKKYCFGFPYKKLYAIQNTDAKEWIIKSDKFKILQSRLDANGVAKNGELPKNGKKVLIFCIHQGVARGLTAALQQKYGKEFVSDALHKTRKKVKEVKDNFNNPKSDIKILIATDILSESVDLHHSCKLMIHYELPWSPLRLFQRVGRLTRIHPKTRAMNKPVRIEHIIVPGSVEEERSNRLIRRIGYLKEQELLPKGKCKTFSTRSFVKGLLGDGPSLHCREYLGYTP